MKRKIIKIDDDKCDGCGLCIPNCPEGALQIIDSKARLVSDLFCDGLGECIGHCPEGAITTEEREAEPYDESKVMENIIKAGPNTIKAHLKHLTDHNQIRFYEEGIKVLKEKGITIPELDKSEVTPLACGCPGSMAKEIKQNSQTEINQKSLTLKSELLQWPVQLQLLNPNAQYFDNADLLISADCVPFAYANFHQKFIKGKITIIFCPKLDQVIDQYITKLAEIFRLHKIKSVTIVRMEVPCCGGIEHIVQKTLEIANKSMMVKVNVIEINGAMI